MIADSVIVGLALLIPAEIPLGAAEGFDLWAMGSNESGQLGDGTTTNRLKPILVASNVVAFDAGSATSYYVVSNDPNFPLETTLFGMGNNSNGQLRQEPALVRSTPVVIDTRVQSVSAGHQHVLYTLWDNRFYSMGGNWWGELGIGSDTDQWRPMLVDSMVTGIAAGGLHSLYLGSDGTLKGMGAAASLGIGETGGKEDSPVTIDTGVVSVVAGGDSLYLKSEGILMGMGYNFNGELGDGSRDEIPWPILIDKEVVQMSNSGLHSLYVRSDGALMGMGYNQSGQLGDGSTTDRLRPIQIDTEVVSAAAGAYHSLYVKADGTLMAVGGNSAGQLGDGTTIRRLRPVVVDTGVVAVSAGDYFSLYLKRRPVPMVLQPPQSVTAEPGSTATFAVRTGGIAGESFEWKRGDTVVGGNSPTLTLSNVQASDAGQYTITVTANGESVSSRAVTLGVKAPPYTEKLSNISTRGQILTGPKIMIAGFVLAGSGQKEVLIRGIGPTLGDFGVPGTCTDPRLELFRVTNPPTSYFAHNEAWGALTGDIPGIMQRVGGFALADGSRDAVLSMQLEPGAYTAQVSGLDGTGVGLVELYDADLDPLASTCNLANISTRGEVGVDSEILIAGFVIAGEVPKQVLVRGIGPRLADFGVDGTLADPYLRILKNVGSEQLWVASNDNWSDNPNAARIVSTSTAVGAFGLTDGSNDAVMLTWLEPGVYTAQVSGVGETTGVALVEVYEVKPGEPPQPAGYVRIEAGTFTMGSPTNELVQFADETQHTVTLTRSFHLATTEVTWAQWNEVRDQAALKGYTDIATGRNGYDGDASGEHPVTEVSWWDVIKWCNLRSELEGKTPVYYTSPGFSSANVLRSGTPTPYANWNADGYRLPTEAEWEFACRAGTTTAFSSGPITYTGTSPLNPNLDKVGWYGGNSWSKTHPVGRKEPNAWDLYDMHGNVWEWCWDWYASYGSGAVEDPEGPDSGADRVGRGGGWDGFALGCRSALRSNGPAGLRYFILGFRPALTAVP